MDKEVRMMTSEQIGEAIAQWQQQMEEMAKKVNGHMEVSYTMPDGGIFSIKYKLPKKN